MTKIEFYSLYGYSDSNIVKVKREGYTDGKYQYYKLGSVWFAIVPGYGASIAEGKTRKEAQAKAHEKTEALKKILETNGEKLRERFLDAPTQEEIEHNARVAEEQHTETETEEEITEEITEPTTEQEEEKEEPAAEESAPVQPAEQAQEAETVVESAEAPAETENEPEAVPESAGDAPAEALETAGFHPIINNLPKKSKWDVWNVHPDEYLSSCVVPLVRCDENYHVLDTVYLKVDTPEEVKTLMSAAAVGNRRRWPKYNKQYRRETVQRAADIIEKYYI